MVRLQRNKKKNIDCTLDFKCDHQIWPWPWPWPWIFKVKYRIGYISATNGAIATKLKAKISIDLKTSNVTIGLDLGHDLDLGFSRSNTELAISLWKWPDCHETISKHIEWTLGLKCDHQIWPWPWPWPWIFKVKYKICFISTKSGPIATKWKANILIWTLCLKCDNGFDLGHDLDIWIFKVICDLDHLVTKVKCKDLPDNDRCDFRCRRAVDSSSWLCSHHRIIMKFSGVITNDKSDVHAEGQGQRSKVMVTEFITPLSRFLTVTPVWIHIWWWNDA